MGQRSMSQPTNKYEGAYDLFFTSCISELIAYVSNRCLNSINTNHADPLLLTLPVDDLWRVNKSMFCE
jgi:hypothetical protein